MIFILYILVADFVLESNVGPILRSEFSCKYTGVHLVHLYCLSCVIFLFF